jgi:ABC-type sugar transport system substrate-binding protein
MTVIPAAVLTLLCALALLVSQQFRGRRRILTQRFSVYLGLPSLTALLVLLPLSLSLSFSDGLSLAGLAISLAFGMGARALERASAKLRIGVAIPSRVPFHVALRAGLRSGLSVARLEVYDDYLINNDAIERLSEFLPALRRTLAWNPDYVIVGSPSVSLVSSDQVMRLLKDFVRRGGGVIFVDNEPEEEALTALRYCGSVTSDVEVGANLLAEFVGREVAPDDEILILSGPMASRPAEIRRKAFNRTLPHAHLETAEEGAWTADGAHWSAKRAFTRGLRPRVIVCGNDVMATGAIRALREFCRNEDGWGCFVVGYDGIPQALFAIAEEGNPFAATIVTPPSAYGSEMAAMILADARRLWYGGSELCRCIIPVGEGQLATRTNVSLMLGDFS